MATPVDTPRPTTRRHAAWRAARPLAKKGSTSSDSRLGFRSYAALMSPRKEARMMQPPFQMRAISPRLSPQFFSFDFARMRFMPCA